MTFAPSEDVGRERLCKMFPGADIIQQEDPLHHEAIRFFEKDHSPKKPLSLHLRGTPFQLSVWQALLSIPPGDVATYGRIAQAIGRPRAHRAVGTAVGKNPISYIIPCHRVIQSTGAIGNYMWSPNRKKLILAHELHKTTT